MVDGVKQTFSRIGDSIKGTSGQDVTPATAQADNAEQTATPKSAASLFDTLMSGASTATSLMQQGASLQQSATQLSNAATRGGSALDAGSLQSAADALRSGTSAVQSGVQSA